MGAAKVRWVWGPVVAVLLSGVGWRLAAAPPAPPPEVARLVAALLGDTPLVADLRQLTDEIGGRPTGSEANLAAVAWGLARFREAGVSAEREGFEMPARWLERSSTARVRTHDGAITFAPHVAAMPFSTATPPGGMVAPLVAAGRGSEEEIAALGERARGAFLLISTEELRDVPGLFAEYTDAAAIEARAFAAGVAGVVYMGSRPRDVLYRHNASLGPRNTHPLLVMQRTAAQRAERLLAAGHQLEIEVTIDVVDGGPYESYNVIGEIRGAAAPEEVVVIGAHLDSWGIGTGALDNGCNVALVIDLARQIHRLGLTPRRTIRFALFNGEEQGLNGSWGYVRRHADELDRHVVASSYDIGSGRITGFFTGGRPQLVPLVGRALEPVAGLGPFTQVDAPIVGTDNFDFMLEGIPNLVADQESANYGPNYHAGTDTFDQVDLHQLRLNAAVAAAVTWSFAQMETRLARESRADVERLVASTDLEQQMRTFGVWDDWADGRRGRAP